MFYDNLKKLCEDKGEKITPLIKKFGYSTGSLTNWRNGTMPNGDILIVFADYFNVTTDYLLGRSDVPTAENGAELTSEEIEIVEYYRSMNEQGRAAFHAVAVSLSKEYKKSNQHGLGEKKNA